LYPRGVVIGTARAVHFFLPQIEQRMRHALPRHQAWHPNRKVWPIDVRRVTLTKAGTTLQIEDVLTEFIAELRDF